MADSVQMLPASDSLAKALSSGDALITGGQALSALRHFDRLLGEHATSAAAFEGLVKALLVAVADESIQRFGEAAELEALLQRLILQEHCDLKPPTLARTIAGLHVTDAHATVASLGKLLSGALMAIHAEGRINRNSVLLLLLLRDAQRDWIADEEVRELHLAWFPRFELEDLTLPYNVLFGSGPARVNRIELCGLAQQPGCLKNQAGACSVMHLLYLEMVTGIRLFQGADDLLQILKQRQQSWDRSAHSAAAARSLIVRYGTAADPAFADYLDALANEHPPPITGTQLPVLPVLAPPAAGVSARGELLTERLQSRLWQGLQAARSTVGRHVPHLRLGRRLKIAVCVSGQLRGYQQAFASWQRAFLPTFDHTIFVHSWESIGRSGAEPTRYILPFEGTHFAKQYRETCLRIGFDAVKAQYPGLFAALAESGRTSAEEVGAFYGTEHVRLDDDRAAPFAGMSNPQKMYTKIEAAFDLALQSGQEFDLMIRLRPDKPIRTMAFGWSDMRELCATTPTLFADHPLGMHYAYAGIGDQFAIGGLEAMTVYSRTASTHPRLAAAGLFQCDRAFTGHFSIGQVCWVHGVRVEKVPMRFGLLQEAKPLGTQAILECLAADSAGRVDDIDRRLVAAARADAGR